MGGATPGDMNSTPPARARIIRPMSETYQSKRERWQRLQETLPAALRGYVAIRNVEVVAALPPHAQERLVVAIQAGLKRLPAAVERLKVNPNLSVEELLTPLTQGDTKLKTEFPQQIQTELSNMIRLCFPDMPKISADALANAEAMNVAQNVVRVHEQLFKSDHLRTDFVMIVICGLMRQTLEHLEALVEQTPSLRQAMEQSALPWKPKDWRR
jgi:hypothetical protein